MYFYLSLAVSLLNLKFIILYLYHYNFINFQTNKNDDK